MPLFAYEQGYFFVIKEKCQKMLTVTMFQLALIFTLNAISTSLGTLKAIFLSKQIIKPVYFTTFLDALIFAYAFKLIADSSGLIFVLAFAMGKAAGIFLGSLIDRKAAIGVIETTVYKHPKQGIILADQLC